MSQKSSSSKSADLKIKAVRCYQSVLFEKQQQTSFTIVDIPGRPKMEISLAKVGSNTDVIEIKSEKDCVHVPLTNISGIYYYNEYDKHKESLRAEEAAKPKNTARAAEIKRPM